MYLSSKFTFLQIFHIMYCNYMKGKNTLCKIIGLIPETNGLPVNSSLIAICRCSVDRILLPPVVKQSRRLVPAAFPVIHWEHMTLAMAYVPWQTWEDTYDVHKGLECGTIFPVLNKPFYGKGGVINDRPSCRTELLNHINAVSFAVDEVKLYLDTHPQDPDALAYFEKYSRMRNQAMKEYAMNFGPLTIDTATASCSEYWKWINEPWPWQEGGC